MRDAGTLCERFQATVAEHGDTVALRSSDGAISLTWREYGARVRRIAAGLAALGVGRGDTVGLMMTNRPEFNLVDAAVFHLGATPYSIYNTAAPDQITHVLSNAESSVVVCDTEFQDRIHASATGTKVEQVVTVEKVDGADLSLAELEAKGEDDFDFDAAWQAVTPDDVLTLIYTSGTTGPPKGVELTHANLIASSASLNEVKAHRHTDRVVSYLPDAHIVNRYVAHYLPALTGLSVTTIRDPKQMLAALTDVRPTVFVAVPMLWYKIKAALEGAVAESGGAKQRLAEWAIDTGRRRARLASDRQPIPVGLKLQHALADRLVLSKLKHRLGVDKIEIAISGAAPIAEEAMEFILALGIPVCEGWGMSELCAFATVNRPGSQRIGTVGLAGPGIEVRLAEDGELLVRGPMVMKGYRNEPELTAEAIDGDGWMHTGDIGTIDGDGYVTIVDRKKELIINDGGKNMSPSNIENHVKVACPLIGSVVAIGDNRKYVTALVTLDADAAAAYAEKHGLTDASPEALAADPGVHAAVEAGVEAANAKLSRVEQIKKFTIVPTFWEPGSDELTPTLKLRRKPIATKYADLIDQLYAD